MASRIWRLPRLGVAIRLSASARSNARLLLAGLVLLTACEKRVDSPALRLGSVSPQVVCGAQLTTRLALTGDGMTPLPIRTLGGIAGGNQPQALQLPAISLIESADLAGTATMGTALTLADDPDSPMSSHVRWQSEMAMSFDVTPDLKLADGIYDIQVTNPDGKTTATLPHAFAAVPPPRILKIEPVGICDEQADQVVKITGSGFLQIGATLPTVTFASTTGVMKTYTPTMLDGCAPVAATVMPGLQICTSMIVTIKKGDLAPGTYTVSVTNPAPANCQSSEPIVIKVSPPPSVTSVTPATICQGGGALDVKGTDFEDTPTVTLGPSKAGSVTFMSSTEVTATFGGGNVTFTPGQKYDLTLTNPDGCSSTLKDAVTAVSGPVLFFVDPPVVFNGITTQVTMYATSVAPPLKSVVITPSSASCSATPVTLSAMVDPNHPKRILAIVPKGTIACDYDVTVTDESGCPATLPKGLRVVAQATVTLAAITPPFGWEMGTTPVTITATPDMSGKALVATPRAYLNPHNAGMNTVATALSSVAFVAGTKLTAIVPKGVDHNTNPYDLIVVNPDGTVGVLTSAYRSEASPPPVIDGISPGSLPVPAGGLLTISGANFANNATVQLTCQGAMPFPAAITMQTAASITVNLANAPFNLLASPNFCVIRVTNPTDMDWGEFSALAVSGASGNLATAHAASDMPEARRGLSLVGAAATRAASFLYVIGGDDGTAAGAKDTVLINSSDGNGVGPTWISQRSKLNGKRTLAGAATLGRYIYIAGGNDGAGPVATVERAIVLDPLQAPSITDVDIVPDAGMGLGGGIWYYRVAALMDPADADNPGGETLPSDEQTLSIPDLAKKLQITITWSAVPGAVGYRIYRTPAAGMISDQEQQIADVGNVLTYTDSGAMPIANPLLPLPQGSTGVWDKRLPAMGAKREGVRLVFGADPMTPSKHYLYAIMGKDMVASATYELLSVTVGNNGQQTCGNAWIPGAKTSPSGGKYFHSAFSADHAIASNVPAGTNYIYFGGGTANGASPVNSLEYGTVTAGTGDLGTLAAAGNATIKSFGQGFATAANYLYGFGNEMPSSTVFAGEIPMGSPNVTNYNNNGNAMMQPRFLPGTVLQGALIYNAGGCNMVGGACATKTVEYFVW